VLRKKRLERALCRSSSLPFLLPLLRCGHLLDSGRFFSRVAVSRKRQTNNHAASSSSHYYLPAQDSYWLFIYSFGKRKEYRWREWMVNETCLCTKSKSLLNCVRYPPIGYHRLQLFSPRIRQTGRQSGWSFLIQGGTVLPVCLPDFYSSVSSFAFSPLVLLLSPSARKH
jgi:hypothetical protein